MDGGPVDGLDASNDAMETVPSTWPSLCGKSRGPSTYHKAVISADQVLQIKQAAHACGGTVNDVLLAAFYLSLSDLTGQKGLQRMSFPVNLRQHLGDGSRVMSNQAANVSFSIKGGPGEGTQATLSKVVKETQRLKTGKIGVREQVAFDRFSDPEGVAVHRMVQEMARGQDEGLANIFISNTGCFALPPFPGLVDAYLCYPGCLMPSTCFVVSTFRGSMSVTIGYQEGDEPREATKRALEGLVGHLSVDVSRVKFI